ncbi:dethiobiotin synthase [Taibaiella sp. KBW10]|uniref:dethiobiotin synthase n=1 Tax=Taibaiella sp. KBW10 TaxID=2153357 RepID=UPI000F5B6793|nr:dethiobiotin synthase [Taibaiella sp. KBW10]RQO32543.1 dethiobiotin synthase [Taibaiella sp. KBW10]
MQQKLFLTGIGTDVGKTICAAVLTAYFQAEYWKPVQAGSLSYTDSMRVRELTGHYTHPEAYRLQLAASPHNAAAKEHIHIKLDHIQLPDTDQQLIIEGAGGLFVPLSDQVFMIDLIAQFAIPAALVVRDYLGCINHSLLSIQALRQRKIPLSYLILNGTFDPDTERVICMYIGQETQVIRIPELDVIDRAAILSISKQTLI